MNTLLRPALPLGLGLLMAGCVVGTNTQRYGPARGPAGIALRLTLDRVRVEGELIAVDSAGLWLLRDARIASASGASRPAPLPLGRLTYVPFVRIWTLRGEGDHIDRPFSTPHSRAWLRPVSRLPQGLTGDLRARLLAAYGQTAPDTLR